MHANKPVLCFGAVALAALALVFSDQPTGRTVLLLTLLVLAALALIEFLGQRAGWSIPSSRPVGMMLVPSPPRSRTTRVRRLGPPPDDR